jgi:hypothetical protein
MHAVTKQGSHRWEEYSPRSLGGKRAASRYVAYRQAFERTSSQVRFVATGFRMAARIDRGHVRFLTRTGLDWTEKYPSAIAALAGVRTKTAYIDGELCGVDEAGLPSFANTQAATDGERGIQLVYYAFDLLHLDGQDVSGLPLVERKALLEPLVAGKPRLQFNGLLRCEPRLLNPKY